MTKEEAIHKLEYSKKAYQTLIDEKVDSGKLVGDGVRGEWKAETSLDEAYKSMIEALEMAIKALEQEPCEDCVSRKLLSDNICEGISCNECSFNEIDGESGCLLQKRFDELPPVQPTRSTAKWEMYVDDYIKCSKCGELIKFYRNYKYCPNCGAKMVESEEV